MCRDTEIYLNSWLSDLQVMWKKLNSWCEALYIYTIHLRYVLAALFTAFDSFYFTFYKYMFCVLTFKPLPFFNHSLIIVVSPRLQTFDVRSCGTLVVVLITRCHNSTLLNSDFLYYICVYSCMLLLCNLVFIIIVIHCLSSPFQRLLLVKTREWLLN